MRRTGHSCSGENQAQVTNRVSKPNMRKSPEAELRGPGDGDMTNCTRTLGPFGSPRCGPLQGLAWFPETWTFFPFLFSSQQKRRPQASPWVPLPAS